MPGPEASSDAELIAGLQEANTALRKTNSGLRQVIDTQAVQIETLTGQIEALLARIAELERRLGSDSTTSSKPPSSDPPYRKPERRSSRTASGRRPGKQPGTGGTTMPLVDNPDQTLYCDVDRSIGIFDGILEDARRLGDGFVESFALADSGWAWLARGEARPDLFARHLELSLQLGNEDGVGYAFEGMAACAAASGDLERAGVLLGASETARLRTEIGRAHV